MSKEFENRNKYELVSEERFSNAKLQKYESKYSESKFWAKTKTIVKRAGKEVLYLALLLYYVLESSDVSIANKAIIIGALGYLIFPADFIPDFIPLAGYADDFSALTAAYKMIKSNITPEIEAKAKSKADELL